MSLCPICGKVYCDHTSEERGQTSEEMMASLTKKEETAFDKSNTVEKIAVAQRVHDAQKKKRIEKSIAFEGLDKKIRINPPLNLSKSQISPSDLGKFAPTGTGLYGLQSHIENPLKEGPIHEAIGGKIFFDNKIEKEDFFALSKILGIPAKKDFAVFIGHSKNIKKDNYLTQLRFVSRFALQYLFRVISKEEYEAFQNQEITMQEAIYEFIINQRQTWGTCFWESPKLAGKFGGDGNYAREELSFGLMVENNYHHVYRIWSRAWLVTK